MSRARNKAEDYPDFEAALQAASSRFGATHVVRQGNRSAVIYSPTSKGYERRSLSCDRGFFHWPKQFDLVDEVPENAERVVDVLDIGFDPDAPPRREVAPVSGRRAAEEASGLPKVGDVYRRKDDKYQLVRVTRVIPPESDGHNWIDVGYVDADGVAGGNPISTNLPSFQQRYVRVRDQERYYAQEEQLDVLQTGDRVVLLMATRVRSTPPLGTPGVVTKPVMGVGRHGDRRPPSHYYVEWIDERGRTKEVLAARKELRRQEPGEFFTEASEAGKGAALWKYLTEEQQKYVRRGFDESDPPILLKVDIGDFAYALQSLSAARVDVRGGAPSKTKGPVSLRYDPDKNVFFIVDGHHRLAEAMMRKDKTIDAAIVAAGYSDYYVTPSAEEARGSDRERWDKLQTEFRRLTDEMTKVESDAHVKFGPHGLRYASRALQSKHEKLVAARSRVYEKIFAMTQKLSPRDWGTGVPTWWVASKLTFDDLVRPQSEPLSVTPPLAYGATRPMQEAQRVSRVAARKIGDELRVFWPDVDLEQFRQGIEIEQEHTSELRVAAQIALDHLREDRHYYTKLKRAGLETGARKMGAVREALENRGREGRRYESAQWLEFECEPATPTPELEDMAREFKKLVLEFLESYARTWSIDTSSLDEDSFVWNAYASLVGHGVGLWEGDGDTGLRGEDEKKIDKALRTGWYAPGSARGKLHNLAHRISDECAMLQGPEGREAREEASIPTKAQLKIINAFREHRLMGNPMRDSISTDGDTIYSYRMPIARRTANGGVSIVDPAGAPSATTRNHIYGLQRTFTPAEISGTRAAEGASDFQRNDEVIYVHSDPLIPKGTVGVVDSIERGGAVRVYWGKLGYVVHRPSDLALHSGPETGPLLPPESGLREARRKEHITTPHGDQFDVVEYTLPVYWASYLINGDASGLENGEQEQIDAWLEREGNPHFVDVSDDSHFAGRNDATNLGGDVATYTAHMNRVQSPVRPAAGGVPRMQNGYAFYTPSKKKGDWKKIPNDDWEHVVVGEDEIGKSSFVGIRDIDGSMHDIFEVRFAVGPRSKTTGYYAQLQTHTRGRSAAHEFPGGPATAWASDFPSPKDAIVHAQSAWGATHVDFHGTRNRPTVYGMKAGARWKKTLFKEKGKFHWPDKFSKGPKRLSGAIELTPVAAPTHVPAPVQHHAAPMPPDDDFERHLPGQADENAIPWKRNVSTGNDLLQVTRNGRIVRMGSDGDFIYSAEYWGDYSLNFPVKGHWRKTLGQAKADLRDLERKFSVGPREAREGPMLRPVTRRRRGPQALPRRIDQTELHKWSERDRAHVELRDKITGETIIEWWDDAVQDAIQDGFLDNRNLHASAFEYAVYVGLIKPMESWGPREARRTAREHNPWPRILGGPTATTFGDLPIGSRFHFPKHPEETLEKVSAQKYRTSTGARFTTGSGTAVVPSVAREVRENPATDLQDAIPWVRVTRDPERYKEALARAQKIGPVDDARKVYELVGPALMKEDQETFIVVLIDVRQNCRGVAEIHRGARSRVATSVLDVMRVVVASGAEGFIVCHNHPSGKAMPSDADRSLTKAIERAAKPFAGETAFLDHVVIGAGEYYSFADSKLHRAKN